MTAPHDLLGSAGISLPLSPIIHPLCNPSQA